MSASSSSASSSSASSSSTDINRDRIAKLFDDLKTKPFTCDLLTNDSGYGTIFTLNFNHLIQPQSL